nr:MAG TPA: hypothetical protein [Caudoviricetes sp.]
MHPTGYSIQGRFVFVTLNFLATSCDTNTIFSYWWFLLS